MEKDWPALAGVLLNSLGDHVAQQGRPTWVRILDAPDAPDAFDVDLDDSPDGLLGWVAPDECLGVGVVATGRAMREGGPEDTEAGPGPDGIQVGTTPGVRLACLVSRSGAVGWRMTVPGGVRLDTPPTEGRLLDCLRRCFELPTPPPPAGAARVQLVVWLLTVHDTIRRTGRQLTWREVAELHPVAALRADPALRHAGPAVIPELIRIAGQTWSWDDLRQGAVRGAWGDDIVTPALAAWMDEGMFARWILSELPAPEELVNQVRPHVSPSTARRLAHVVRSAA
jgi:hypothetical protein